MIMKEAPPGHRSRCKEEDVIIAIEKETNRILHYQKVGHERKLDFPKVSIKITNYLYMIKSIAKMIY